MKVIFTSQALKALEETLIFLLTEQKLPINKVIEIRDRLIDKAESLALNPFKGQKEEYLMHLGMDYRRIIQGNIKMIYKVAEESIYIIDFFDSRQDPNKMKG